MEVAQTIKDQLRMTGGIFVVGSWGAREWLGTPASVHGDVILGALRFRVSGRKFKGIIEIALMPSDTYRVTLFKMDKRQPRGIKIVDIIEDVYWDNLVKIIDEKIET